jgi:hypothetical protein
LGRERTVFEDNLRSIRTQLSQRWAELGTAARAGVLAATGAVLGLALGAILLVSSGGAGDAPVDIVTLPTATATAAPTQTATAVPTSTAPTATATATATATSTATPEPPVVQSIVELADRFGEPPDATYGRFRIPAIGVDAPLGTRFVGGDGQMPNPTGPGDVVWYDFSEWEGYGGPLGGGRNAIFSGHADYAAYVAYADTQFRGRGVFYGVSLLSPGDVVEVEVNGQTLTYAVEWRQLVSADGADWATIMSSDVTSDSITLITCGGEFNFATRQYQDRIVVRAVRS